MADTLEIPSLLGGPLAQAQFNPSQGQWPLPTQLWAMGRKPDPRLVDTVIQHESSNRPDAKGKKGEVGLMQITPLVAKQYGVTMEQLKDPTVNREVGSRYLGDLLKRYHGSVSHALAAYNAGPTMLDAVLSGKRQLPTSTKSYVSRIMSALGSGLEGTAYADEPPGKPIKINPSEFTSSKIDPKDFVPAKADAAPTKTGAESLYEKAADPLRDFVARGLTGIDPRNLLSMPTAEKIQQFSKGTQPVAPWAKTAAGMAVPGTLTGAGEQAGLWASGLGEMGLLARLGIGGLGGAAGSYLEGKSPLSGAAGGAATVAGGDIVGGLTGVAGRFIGKDRVLKQTASDIGTSLNQSLGSRINMTKAPADVAAVERVFKLGVATQRAGQLAGEVSQRAEQAMGGRTFRVSADLSPTPITLKQGEELIESLNEGSFMPTGVARSVQGRGAMLRQAAQLREQIARQLNAKRPGMGTLWRQSRRDYGAAKALQDMFQEPGVFNENVINQPKLEQLITSKKYWNRLKNTLGDSETAHLLKTVRRGGVGPSADIPGKEAHLRFGLGGHPHLGMPHTYKPAGNIPALLRKAGKNPARYPGGMATGAAIDFLNAPLDSGESTNATP